MAQRRMFSPSVVGSDSFLDMGTTARELYFELGIYADDDGFISPKKIMRMTGASEDDLKVLIAKNFVIPFESGVVVVRHWKTNNLIRKDWYRETVYKTEKAQLASDVNDNYVPKQLVNEPLTTRYQNVNGSATEVRLGKVRLNNVNGTKEERRESDERKTVLHQLPNREQSSEETGLITDDILVALGDQHSQPFYALVAAKVPESVIRQKLSEIKQRKTRSPAKVFTSAMKAYATAVLQKREMSSLMSPRKDLFRI
jgi:hypothetical protein